MSRVGTIPLPVDGPSVFEGGVRFSVWAPFRNKVELGIVKPDGNSFLPMERDEDGYWHVTAEGIGKGASYLYRLDSVLERPDPASNLQPEGVHGPSRVVDHSAFGWDDGQWRGIGIARMVMYELHVGAFTPAGTFDAVMEKIVHLKELGINAVELMPVAEFPGGRNWGYDGAYPFAVQHSYGGPEGLKRLVNQFHKEGIAVVLDVVYNHIGPEGNYLADFGPYFTDRYRTDWGDAINFDGPYSDHVRGFFIASALHWFRHYHVDGLRLDAVHGIVDASAAPFLAELVSKVRNRHDPEAGRSLLIAESDLNDARLIRPAALGGHGFDAQWNDDYHHALHCLLTAEDEGYYRDFGSLRQLAESLRNGYVYDGRYSFFRKRRHGSPSKDRPYNQFVVFSQNHDQTGNRMHGERLGSLVPFEALKLAAGAVLLSPFVPLLFMGEEYGETAPFLYFTSFGDASLAVAVRNGRREYLRGLGWSGEPADPQTEETFAASRLNWELLEREQHRVLFSLYRELIRIRATTTGVSCPGKEDIDVTEYEGSGVIILRNRAAATIAIFNFSGTDKDPAVVFGREHSPVMDSADRRWLGPGSLLPEYTEGEGRIGIRAGSFVLLRERVS